MVQLDRALIVLKTIYENPPLSLYEIQKKTPLPKSTTRKVVLDLVEKNILYIQNHKVFITDKGYKFITIL